MTVRDDFVERFALLKETYQLTYPELNKILGINGKSTVNEWIRAKKSFPNETVLVIISNIFAVSIDWLLGRIDRPYNEDILTKLEEEHAVAILEMKIAALLTPLPKEYKNTKLRRKYYTQGQRANLIYAAMSLSFLNDDIASFELIRSLLYRELKAPIFDLETAIEIHHYHKLLERYEGCSLSDIDNEDDLKAIKKGMHLPITKKLKYTFRTKEWVKDVVIEEIYRPSYSCRLRVTTQEGKTHLVLSDCFAEMQQPPQKAKATIAD